MSSFARALRSLNPSPKPRTEMICDVCGGFSSTRRCFVCSSSPAGLALSLAEAHLLRLEGLEEENQRLRDDLRDREARLETIAKYFRAELRPVNLKELVLYITDLSNSPDS